MLVEESRLSPLRPRSQFVFLAACGTRPSCSRWRAASTRMLELLRYLAASKRPAAPHMVMGHAGAVGGVLRSKAYILGLRLEELCRQSSTQVRLPADVPTRRNLSPTRGRFEAAARKDSGGRGEARACRARERDVGGTVGERAFSLSNPPILIPNSLAALAFAHRQRRPCSTDTWWALRVAGG